MHTLDILEQGHAIIMSAIAGIDDWSAELPGVYGAWSVKEVMGHIAAYESILLDILTAFSEDAATPDLDRWLTDPHGFDEQELFQRRNWSLSRVVRQYQAYHDSVIDQMLHIPEEKLLEQSLVPWHEVTVDTEDLIVELAYQHKREHAEQISAFFNGQAALPGASLPEMQV